MPRLELVIQTDVYSEHPWITDQCPAAIDLRRITLAFRSARGGEFNQLRRWIEAAKRCEFGPVARFAYGLQKDISAVAAAVDTPWSTGQVEGREHGVCASSVKSSVARLAHFILLSPGLEGLLVQEQVNTS